MVIGMSRQNLHYLVLYFVSALIMAAGITHIINNLLPQTLNPEKNIQFISKPHINKSIKSNQGQPDSEHTGLPVYVGYYVNKVNTHNNGNARSFYTDFYVWFRWPGKLGEKLPVEYMNSLFKPEITDETSPEQKCSVQKGEQYFPCNDVDNTELPRWHYKVMRVRGDFMYDLDLKTYPFDSQKLNVELEMSQHLYEQAYFTADNSSHIPDRLKVSGWMKGQSSITTEAIAYDTNFGILEHQENKTLYYARSTLSLDVTRDPLPYILKTLAPLFIIIFTGSLAFFLLPSNGGTRLSLTTGALLTAIALHITVSSSLPNVGLLTIMDRCFINGYLHICAATVETIIVGKLYTNHMQRAQQLDRISYLLFPLTLMVGFYFATNIQ